MIRNDLLGIILRLVAGFAVLFAISFFLWRGLRRNTPQPEPTPTSITVVTPNPTPTLSTLPTVGPETSNGKDSNPPDSEKDRRSSPVEPKKSDSPEKKTITITKTYTYYIEETTHTPTGHEGSSAWAEARAGGAWARAQAGY